MDVELKDRVAEAAKESLRSLQTEIEFRLRSTFDQKSDEAAA